MTKHRAWMASHVFLSRMLGNNTRQPPLFFLRIPFKRKDPQRHQLTFLILIPKKIEVSFTHDSQPTSLISCPYKVLAKVLLNRIKEVLNKTIDGNQFAFVKDRNIMDCILIANKSAEDYRHRKKNKKRMILKLDLEKAYDYTNWDFLNYMMAWKGFGSKWRTWIYGCLKSSHFSIFMAQPKDSSPPLMV